MEVGLIGDIDIGDASDEEIFAGGTEEGGEEKGTMMRGYLVSLWFLSSFSHPHPVPFREKSILFWLKVTSNDILTR